MAAGLLRPATESPSLTPWLSRSRFADGQTSAGLGLGRVEGWSNHEVSLPSLPPCPSSFRASCERHLRENREQRRPAVFCLYVYRVSRPVDDKGWRPGMTRAGGRREAGLTQCADDMMRSCAHENPARCRRSPLQAPGVWGWNPHNRHLRGSLTQWANDMMRNCSHGNPARCRRSPLQA